MPNEFKVKNGLLVSGSANISASGSAVFTIDGTAGRLFTVDDTTSGSLFSVNTSAGLPIIEAFSDNTVRVGQFGQRALFVSQSKVGINKESALNGLLDVSGSLTVTGSVGILGVVSASSYTGSLLGTASFAISSSRAISSSFASNADLLDGAHLSILATTGSNTFIGNQTITGSITLSSSAAVELTVIGNQVNTGSITSTLGFTGSLLGTASFAVSASWAPNTGGGGGSITVADEGTTQGTATYFNFLGAGVTAAVASNTASITITSGGGGGTPGGANTTIQFNDSSTFSGSGNFTFTKATNTVKIQGSGSILLHITGSQGDLLRIQDSGSSAGTLAVISSGSRNVATFTTSSVIITGSLQVSGSLTASLQRGYTWVGDSNGVATATPRVNTATSLFLFFNY